MTDLPSPSWSRRSIVAAGAALATAGAGGLARADAAEPIPVSVDLRHTTGPIEHVWSRCAGSDRAEITLRESWRHDLDRFHKEAGLERVRFHGIFNDELGVWPLSGAQPNFQNVDQVYDGLLERGVQPFVELSFMPGKLASASGTFGFYHANVTPPTSLPDWAAFIQQFVRHLIARYGAAEVRQWYFEVWNEPNLIPFWRGTQAQYFELYKATAAAVKGVDPTLRVGGPSTSATQWIPQFLDYCTQANAPVDFVSTHIYPGDSQTNIFGHVHKYSQNDVIPAAMAQVRAQIDATRFKGTQLWLGEWSSDSPAMIAHVITNCLPYCQAMSQWAMSSVFEEIKVADWLFREGGEGWGMLAQHSIAKPAFNTYKLLNKLGKQRLEASGPALATRTDTGGAAILVWNLAQATQAAGLPEAHATRTVTGDPHRYGLRLLGAHPGRRARISYVDQTRGSALPAWRAMGSPQYPSLAQLAQLRQAAEIGPPEMRRIGPSGELSLELPPEGVALIEI